MPRVAFVTACLALGLWNGSVILGETIDPDGTSRQYAYQEGSGWLNAEPLGDGGPGAAIFSSTVVGWLWSELVGWISLSCENTQTCSAVDYGIANDGAGRLSGFAWGESIGWISCSCATTASCPEVDHGVQASPVSGMLSGFAWAENLGWISFSCLGTSSCDTVDFGVATLNDIYGAVQGLRGPDPSTNRSVSMDIGDTAGGTVLLMRVTPGKWFVLKDVLLMGGPGDSWSYLFDGSDHNLTLGMDDPANGLVSKHFGFETGILFSDGATINIRCHGGGNNITLMGCEF